MICEFSPILQVLPSLDKSLVKSLQYRPGKSICGTRLGSVEPCYTYRRSSQQGTLEIDLPGVEKDNIVVEVQGNRLRVTGKRVRFIGDVPNSKRPKVYETDAKGPKRKLTDNSEDKTTEMAAASKATKVDTETDVKGLHARTSETSSEENRGQKDGEKKVSPRSGEANEEIAVTYKAQFHLHPNIDTQEITVEKYENGVLSLKIPTQKDYVRQISVS